MGPIGEGPATGELPSWVWLREGAPVPLLVSESVRVEGIGPFLFVFFNIQEVH